MPDDKIDFIVQQSGERLDKTIMAHIGDRLSRAQLQALIEEGRVLVDGRQVKPGTKLKGGEHISLTIPVRETAETVQPEALPLQIIYEDDDLAVIDKPAGMVVHPGELNETGTLVSALLHRWPQIATMNIEEKRAGIVHRLDKDTSGLIVIAKHDRARRHLTEQFQARTVEKVYTALLEKRPQTSTGRIEAPIGRDPKQRKRMAVLREGRPAISEYTVIDDDFPGGFALVKVRLLTGRTHQIRVHMAFIGCPIVGDRVYGYRKQRVGLKRQFLHASELAFDQPTTGERLHFESPLPAGLQNILTKLRG
ncbi:MAG TPA: RluA family pseudouridine synthase [Spirillospora sp.]|nr:RluA family pseudouridine synthase [Spirillospora sp.]